MSILVSGSLAYDYIMNFPDSFKNHIMPDQIHILNVCFVVDKLKKSWGGTAGNIAYTMKMLEGEPLIISALGKDARDYIEHFKKLGIITNYITESPDKLTASAYITTDMDDNQVTAFYNGPLGEVPSLASANHPSPLPSLRSGQALGKEGTTSISPPVPKGSLSGTRGGVALAGRGGGSVSLAIISPTDKTIMMKHLHECHERGIPAMFDPGQQITAFTDVELRSMISKSHFVIGNDYEMKLLQDRTGWSAGDILKETHVLITTLGEKGSIITTNDGATIEVASCPPRSVDDPTGAGDAFRAGFLVGFEKGLDIKTCGQMGAVAASYAIETYGTQEHQFSLTEFSDRYQKTYQEKITL